MYLRCVPQNLTTKIYKILVLNPISRIMTSHKYDFSSKVILITGSSSGIGAACALQFAQCNAKLVITGLEEDEVKQTVERIQSITGEAPLSKVGSILDPTFAESLVQDTVQHYGRLDVLMNNAGRGCTDDSILNPNVMPNYETIMDLNVKSVIRMTHLCIPHLEKTKGCVINTASIASFCPLNQLILYSASKAAVAMITKCAALELGPKGIRVNSVNPGPIRTNIGRSVQIPNLFLDDVINPLVPHTIMKRLGEPDEVANLVLFLASSEASYITGANYLVDGGYTCL